MFKLRIRMEGEKSSCHGEAQNDVLVIFDKDGTLITKDSWIDWTIDMAEKCAQKLQQPIQQELYNVMSFDVENRIFSDGLICETDANIIKAIASFLQTQGLEAEDAQDFVESIFFSYEFASHKTMPVDDPKAIFTELKKHGVKIAVCTSDSVPGKDAMIRDLELWDLVDFSLCGDEPAFRPKPYAGNVTYICERVGVAPSGTIVVGDAVRDMEMGRGANVRLNIGVLSGVANSAGLREAADVVIPSIKDILPIVIPGYKQ